MVPEDRDNLDIDLAAALAVTDGGRVQLWIREVDDTADALAVEMGFRQYRDLWQLRCVLPNAPSQLATRGFTIDDLDEFVEVTTSLVSHGYVDEVLR